MAESQPSEMTTDEWNQLVEQMNRTFQENVERTIDLQTAFAESWTEAIEQSEATSGQMTDWLQGYARAYETWMRASEQMFELANASFEGEEIDVEAFRDIWLDAANTAFKDVMSTDAFAAATGQSVDQVLDFKQQWDEITQSTLHNIGFATEGDVVEVGQRLVELERRQHAVEEKLDRILESIEE